MALTYDAHAAAIAARPTLVGRARSLARDRKVVAGMRLLATVAVIGAGLALTLLSRESTTEQRSFLMTSLLAHLDAGELAEARKLATHLRQLSDASLAERGAALNVLGTILASEAQQCPNESHRRAAAAQFDRLRRTRFGRPDADFLRSTRLDRQQCDDLLGWLRTL